jgi:GntR family transcriptional regulator, vanillate catabolism transcriptional regulator
MSSEPAFSIEPMKRTRLVDEVTARLREMIVSGQLGPGRQLLQTELAEVLGVSRTPLREAFRVLENDGLVRISNRNGTIEVVSYNADDLREMYEVREVVDGLAARLSARRGLSDEATARFVALLTDMREASRPYDPIRRTEAHAAFHSLVIECSGNSRLAGLLPLVRVSSAALYLPFNEDPSAAALLNEGQLLTHQQAMDGAQDFHQQIFSAIVDRDEKRAETIARRHIVASLKFVGRMDEWREAIVAARAAAPPAQP